MRCVVAADVARCDGLAIALTGIAARFEPHITLYGRFRPALFNNRDDFASRIADAVGDLAFPPLTLLGPRRIGEDMAWYEADRGGEGYDALMNAHLVLGRDLRERDLVEEELLPAHFRGPGYRPHMTTARGAVPTDLDEAGSVRVKVTALSLYMYTHLPDDSVVSRQVLRHLDN